MSSPYYGQDPRISKQAHADARLTQTLLFAQLVEQSRQHAAAVRLEQEQLRLAQSRADLQARFQWSQYLAAPAGAEYERWEEAASGNAGRVGQLEARWEEAWSPHLAALQGPIPAPPPKPASGMSPAWPLLVAALVIVSIIWVALEGFAAVLSTLIWVGIPGAFIARSAQKSKVRQVALQYDRLLDRILQDRAKERMNSFGLVLTREQFIPKPTIEFVNTWYDVSIPTLIKDFIDSAYITYPQERDLPWHLTKLPAPRDPLPKFPDSVTDLLESFARLPRDS